MMPANTIAMFTVAAFVVYITMRGELRGYLGFLLGSGGSA